MDKTFLINQKKIIKEHIITFENLRQAKDDRTNWLYGCILEYVYFETTNYKIIAKDLSK